MLSVFRISLGRRKDTNHLCMNYVYHTYMILFGLQVVHILMNFDFEGYAVLL